MKLKTCCTQQDKQSPCPNLKKNPRPNRLIASMPHLSFAPCATFAYYHDHNVYLPDKGGHVALYNDDKE